MSSAKSGPLSGAWLGWAILWLVTHQHATNGALTRLVDHWPLVGGPLTVSKNHQCVVGGPPTRHQRCFDTVGGPPTPMLVGKSVATVALVVHQGIARCLWHHLETLYCSKKYLKIWNGKLFVLALHPYIVHYQGKSRKASNCNSTKTAQFNPGCTIYWLWV